MVNAVALQNEQIPLTILQRTEELQAGDGYEDSRIPDE